MSKLFEAQDGDYIQLPWAKFVFHNNEWHVDGRGVNDPTGGSFLGGNGCKLSWKNEQGEEMVLFQMRRNQDNDGEYYFGALNQAKYQELLAKGDQNALDHAMIEVATINPKGIEFRVPVKFSAGALGLIGINNDTIWSPDGLSFTQQQNDKNFVTYKVDRPYDKTANPVALWASGTNQ
jgi:hypothetical protein